LLENIKSLKFRYLSEESKDLSENSWLESWKSQDTIDIKMRNKFPAAVEVHIVLDRERRANEIKTVIALHSPNNNPFEFKDSGTPQTTPTPSPQKAPGTP
jgi:hypothetical protein